MSELFEQLEQWLDGGQAVAVATVISTEGSAPRPPGTKMAIGAGGTVVGAVSGGCVESAVTELAQQLLEGERGPGIVHFGISDEQAMGVGLVCGGEISLWLDTADDAQFALYIKAQRAGKRGALLTELVSGRRLFIADDVKQSGSLGEACEEAEQAATHAAAELMRSGESARLELLGRDIFIDVTSPPPRLIIVGASELSEMLSRLAALGGWRPFVIDPRGFFVSARDFPAAEQLISAWPAQGIAAAGGLDDVTPILILTHDPKIDLAALDVALRSDTPYIGVMGSRRAQQLLRERLRERGFNSQDVARLSGPVGLDIGGVSAFETALSMIAELIAQRHGRGGGRLVGSQAERIHSRSDAANLAKRLGLSQ
jgi:xanthine dehydrogenase accessory factor